MIQSRRFFILAMIVGFVVTSCGFEVEPLTSTANLRVTELSPGDTVSFQDIFEQECETVIVVGAYTADDVRDDLIGRASISMEGQDQFVIAATFDQNGERVEATRFQRVPVDFDDLAGDEIGCDDPLIVVGGVALPIDALDG